ncbi:MAG: hypothetical protein BRD57_04275 [Proteobacteria bacterium SW_6_67_9]|jgi:uncharacterized coiled-coil protein SlyX|nr:MAG: hypothetical protein BRD57_04275 [Proteobacteria bacterium SW_6_67_9]
MSDTDRVEALEEQVAWLRHELEQLDATIRAESAARERLAQQLARIERRLERIEQGNADDAD